MPSFHSSHICFLLLLHGSQALLPLLKILFLSYEPCCFFCESKVPRKGSVGEQADMSPMQWTHGTRETQKWITQSQAQTGGPLATFKLRETPWAPGVSGAQRGPACHSPLPQKHQASSCVLTLRPRFVTLPSCLWI